MRHMSFSMTIDQVYRRTKLVTRRVGWWDLERGDRLLAIEKGQGLKRGEHVVPIGTIHVILVWPELLDALLEEPYGASEMILEGFPGMPPAEFVAAFQARYPKRERPLLVNRIQFVYV